LTNCPGSYQATTSATDVSRTKITNLCHRSFRRPVTPVSQSYRPASDQMHQVKDSDSRVTLAREKRMSPWEFIRYNYPGLPSNDHQAAPEVNWYLQDYVGCTKLTADSKNYCFSSAVRSKSNLAPGSRTPRSTIRCRLCASRFQVRAGKPRFKWWSSTGVIRAGWTRLKIRKPSRSMPLIPGSLTGSGSPVSLASRYFTHL
jgi:hypothetical protein